MLGETSNQLPAVIKEGRNNRVRVGRVSRPPPPAMPSKELEAPSVLSFIKERKELNARKFSTVFFLLIAIEKVFPLKNREKTENLDGCNVYMYINTSGSTWFLCCLLPIEKGNKTR